MIHFQLLGPVDLIRDESVRVASVLTQPKRVALLAYIALAHPRGLHRRDELLAMFWPELSEDGARAALRQALFFLRRSLGSEVISNRGADEVGIDRELLRIDVEEVEATLHAAGAGPSANPELSLDAEAALEALALRPLLNGFHVAGLPDFDRWLEGERLRLRELAQESASRLAAAAAETGEADAAARSLALALRLDPFDTDAANQSVALRLRCGDQAGAELLWREFEARYHAEIGETPTRTAIAGRVEREAPTRQAAVPRADPAPPLRDARGPKGFDVGRRSGGTPRSLPKPLRAMAAAAVLLLFAGAITTSIDGRSRPGTDGGVPGEGTPMPPGIQDAGAILWVDDNPRNNELERARLRAAGVDVTVAFTTGDALSRLDANPFRVVISDMGRYREGSYEPRAGLDLLRRVRERPDPVRVIFYTSDRAVLEHEDEAMVAGAAGMTSTMDDLFRLIAAGARSTHR